MSSLCPWCFCPHSQRKHFLGFARNDHRFRDVAPSTVAVLAQVKVRVRLATFLCSSSVFVPLVVVVIRDFKIQRCGRERERQKNNRFYKQNNNFARASHLFAHFFSRFCTTTTWKCLISRFMENVNKERRNSMSPLSELGYGPQEFNSRRVRQHLTKLVCRNNWDKDWKNANSLFKRRYRCHRVVES